MANNDLFVSVAPAADDAKEKPIPPVDDLIVNVANDPPLETRTAKLLALAPYKPDDRNAILRKGFGREDADAMNAEIDDRPPTRSRATPRPALLKGIDIYGGDLDSSFQLYMGGDDAASNDGEDVLDPASYFELSDD